MLLEDGRKYLLQEKPKAVVKPGEFIFSVAHLNHGHIFGMTDALVRAGATLKYVYDPDAEKMAAFLKRYPMACPAQAEEVILADQETRLVAAAAIPSERCGLGLRVIDAGKDYFTDKTPLTTLEQLQKAKAKVKETGRKYMVYFCERLHVESAILAGYMIEQGVIGKVMHVTGFGPHQLGAAERPDWFYNRKRYGGILCDIGSHQIEQYLSFTGEEDADVVCSRIANYAHPDHPDLDDFGDCNLTGKKGTTNYFRVDWFTPDGLRTWGDGRTFIVGTDGFIELRKYINLAADQAEGNHLFVANHQGERYIKAIGVTGFPFFSNLILDCLNRTETAMTQEHAWKAAELCLKAQLQAEKIRAGI